MDETIVLLHGFSRDEVVADLRSLVSSARVVSLVGAGGLGKTRTAHLVGRLAQRVAL